MGTPGYLHVSSYLRAKEATAKKNDTSQGHTQRRGDQQDKPKPPADNRYQPVAHSEEGSGTVVFRFLFDASGSMKGQYSYLQEMMRDVAVPGIKGIEKRVRKCVRVACSLFSNDISSVWLGYRAPDQIGGNPLPDDAFKAPGLGGCTALYSSILSSLTDLEQSLRFYSRKGTVSGKFLVLTDGAEYSNSGLTPQDVYKRLAKYKEGTLIESVLVYFETGDSVSQGTIEKLAKDMGFSTFWYFGSDDPLAMRQRKFRNELNLFSSRLDKKS